MNLGIVIIPELGIMRNTGKRNYDQDQYLLLPQEDNNDTDTWSMKHGQVAFE